MFYYVKHLAVQFLILSNLSSSKYAKRVVGRKWNIL